jgi:hypothetical protein
MILGALPELTASSSVLVAVAGLLTAVVFRFAREFGFLLAVVFATANALASARYDRGSLIVRVGRASTLVYPRRKLRTVERG